MAVVARSRGIAFEPKGSAGYVYPVNGWSMNGGFHQELLSDVYEAFRFKSATAYFRALTKLGPAILERLPAPVARLGEK